MRRKRFTDVKLCIFTCDLFLFQCKNYNNNKYILSAFNIFGSLLAHFFVFHIAETLET